ncbi:helix-loop-helix DNA-binding domain-containing protein [Tothia fuscella]|uniref:Helix-loop-helix DNA-binding domain-containing protein n=1 Tax=Tothia fuscella TaxID=1048955 RepID=A0A9P4NQZ8_9PEZI|nr:helix-loop-helix DNA-binding domain-containing protein [Tothia fuscella]
MNSKPSNTPNKSDNTPPKEKPRLTEQEKKNNHIASEQKRRQAIREGFDRLASLVPNMEGQGRSEALVLDATIEEINKQIAAYKRNIAEMEARGIDTSQFVIPDVDPQPANSNGKKSK